MSKKYVWCLIIAILCSMILLCGCGTDEGSDESQSVQNNPMETIENDVVQEEKKEETEVVEMVEMQNDDNAVEEEKINISEMVSGLYDTYYPVYLFVDYEENLILNKDKKLKIYVDGDELEKIEQGTETCYAMILSKGTHTLKVSTSFINSDTKNFIVDKDAYMDDIPSFIYCTLAFSGGDATIDSIFRLDEVEFEGNTDLFRYYTLALERAQNQYQAIDNFEEVMKQYGELQ